MTTPRVETSSGRLAGEATDGVVAFRGIPFAEPPTGPRRFRPPVRIAPWAGVRDATRFGASAPQEGGLAAALLGGAAQRTDEDCLSLNVWTPAADAGRRPLLVWLHGGGFATGAGSLPLFDGSRLARRGDVVVASVNYRLGALGWLALPAFGREEGGAAGNFGLLDQLEALAWLRENAAAFGADPDRITVFGESAGAMSIGALLGVPFVRRLLRRAVLQSGSAANVHSADTAARVAHRFLEAIGLREDATQALREAPLAALMEAQKKLRAMRLGLRGALPFQPVVDGRVLPRAPQQAVAAGDLGPTSLVVGTNHDEWNLFALTDVEGRAMDDGGLLRRLERVLPGGAAQARRALELYRGLAPAASPLALWSAVETDRLFWLPALRLAEAQARHARETFVYEFGWRSPGLGGMLGACHGLELPFVFGNVSDPKLRGFVGEGPEVEALSRQMQDAWIAFAHAGEPGRPGGVAWPAYTAEERATFVFARESGVACAPRDEVRRFWEGLSG
jgi:para-nitrobenzyl esterase